MKIKSNHNPRVTDLKSRQYIINFVIRIVIYGLICGIDSFKGNNMGSSLNVIQHSSDSHFTSYSLFFQFNQLLVQSLASSIKEKRTKILVQSINLYYFIIPVVIIQQLFFTLMNMFAFSKNVYVFNKIYGVKMTCVLPVKPLHYPTTDCICWQLMNS